MPPRICCCDINCELGTDDFDRPDSADPGPLWKIVAGTGAIVSNQIHVNGKVATTICHPVGHDHGSFIARFDLVNLRSVALFEVGVGDPNSSPYSVKFEPSGMDTPMARITVTVIGTTTKSFAYVWPLAPNGLSTNELEAIVCYQPGALLRGAVAAPTVDTCIPGPGDRCYVAGGTNVGNFFFKHGHFDNWVYFETILDNFGCDPCGCFCFKREGTLKEFSCYPETLFLNFTLVSGTCPDLDGVSIPMTQGLLSPGDGHPQKVAWFSGVYNCNGLEYAFVLNCVNMTVDGTNWFQALSLRITDGFYVNSSVIFQWVGVVGSTQNADYSLSTCEPLSLVFPSLSVQSFFGPCGSPGQFGYYLFCCPGTPCSPVPQTAVFNMTVTT